jgi:hypothetical protein
MTPSAVETATYWRVKQGHKYLRQRVNLSKNSSLIPEVEEASDFTRTPKQTVIKSTIESK